MPQKARVIKVGGVFEVDLGCSMQKRKAASAIVELYDLISPFFPGNADEKFRGISEMFRKAKLANVFFLFSFPKEIRKKYNLEITYRIRLKMGEPTRFYVKELMPHLNAKKCEFKIRGLEEGDKIDILSFFGRMSKTCRCANVLSISITKWKDAFGIGINLEGGEKIKLQGCVSLEEAKSWIEKNIIS